MYSRLINKTPKTIVHNGKINFGTFSGVTDYLDIRGVKAPFAGVPTARFFSNFRIKSRMTYIFSIENYIGLAEFFDDKAFGLAEVIFWNKETNQKLAYHKFMGPRRRFVPIDTSEASCVSFGKTRYIKIKWSRLNNKLGLSFTVKGDKFRPAAKGKFISDFSKTKKGELLSVKPSPTTKRCSATWYVPMNLSGGIEMAKHRKQIKNIPLKPGLGLLMVNRTYLKARSYSERMIGFFEYEGKKIKFIFSNTSQTPLDEDKYNDNMLSVDDEITAMPSVCITHPFGIDKKWIVQDTESMVDLSFEPISCSKRTLSIIIMRNTYSTIYGNFEGVLLTKTGEKIVLKNCSGIVKKSMLRL